MGKGLRAITFILGDFPIVLDIKTYEIDLDERYIYQPIDYICQSPTGKCFLCWLFLWLFIPYGKKIENHYICISGRTEELTI